MPAQRTALLIIDMISAFDFPEAARLQRSVRSAARRISELRSAFHRRGMPVIYANDNFANWRVDFAGLVDIATASGTLGRDVVALLRPQPDEYFILKPKHSAFLATALPVLLAKLGVGTLQLTGMTADSCVLATALDANAREYRVQVIEDAIAGLAGPRAKALGMLRCGDIAEVIDMSTALARIRSA